MLVTAERTKMKLYNIHRNIKFKVINEVENGIYKMVTKCVWQNVIPSVHPEFRNLCFTLNIML